jgi:hypothetical protein
LANISTFVQEIELAKRCQRLSRKSNWTNVDNPQRMGR